MSQDATTVQLGAALSNVKEVTNKKGLIAAGLIVRLKSDGTISTAKSDGNALGISMGIDQSGTGRTAIARKGLGVPICLASGFTSPAIGDQVAIDDTTGLAVAYTGTGNTHVNAFYATAKKSALKEDGTAFADGAALIDFIGGL